MLITIQIELVGMKGSPAEDVPLALQEKCFFRLTAWESLGLLWAHLSASLVVVFVFFFFSARFLLICKSAQKRGLYRYPSDLFCTSPNLEIVGLWGRGVIRGLSALRS